MPKGEGGWRRGGSRVTYPHLTISMQYITYSMSDSREIKRISGSAGPLDAKQLLLYGTDIIWLEQFFCYRRVHATAFLVAFAVSRWTQFQTPFSQTSTWYFGLRTRCVFLFF